ncbi:TPA: hypothetical protein ACINL5_000505 [Streptococcus agalactiae]
MDKIDLDYAKRNGLDEVILSLHQLTNDKDSYINERAYRGVEVYKNISKGIYDRIDLASYVNEGSRLTKKADKGELTPSEIKLYNAVHLASMILINQLVKEQVKLSTVIKQLNNIKGIEQTMREEADFSKPDTFDANSYNGKKGVASDRVKAIRLLLREHPLDLLWLGYKKEGRKLLRGEVEKPNFETFLKTKVANVVNQYRQEVGIDNIMFDYNEENEIYTIIEDRLTSLPNVKLTMDMFYDYFLNSYIFNDLNILEKAKSFNIRVVKIKMSEEKYEEVKFRVIMKLS